MFTNTAKKTDKKGRLVLGSKYAESSFLLEEQADASGSVVIILKPVEQIAIPQNEAWLFKNPEALGTVMKGLKQAAEKKFVPSPRKSKKQRKWLDEIED